MAGVLAQTRDGQLQSSKGLLVPDLGYLRAPRLRLEKTCEQQSDQDELSGCLSHSTRISFSGFRSPASVGPLNPASSRTSEWLCLDQANSSKWPPQRTVKNCGCMRGV